MKVIQNHFNGNDTILIHDSIINGCQDFTLEEADPILEKYRVPSIIWRQVLDAYTGTSTDEDFDRYIDSSNDTVRAVIAQYANDIQRDKLLNDKAVFVRMNLIKYGNNYHQLKLINDRSPTLRASIACYGTDEHRDILINDAAACVKRAIIQYGNDKHRSQLSNDTMIKADVQYYTNLNKRYTPENITTENQSNNIKYKCDKSRGNHVI